MVTVKYKETKTSVQILEGTNTRKKNPRDFKGNLTREINHMFHCEENHMLSPMIKIVFQVGDNIEDLR